MKIPFSRVASRLPAGMHLPEVFFPSFVTIKGVYYRRNQAGIPPLVFILTLIITMRSAAISLVIVWSAVCAILGFPCFGQEWPFLCGMFRSSPAYLEMLPRLGPCPPLPYLQVSLCCVGNQYCVYLDVSADSIQLGELGWTSMANSVPLVEYLCSEVIDPLHAILLNYIIHLEFSEFWGFFGKFDMLPCLFFFF